MSTVIELEPIYKPQNGESKLAEPPFKPAVNYAKSLITACFVISNFISYIVYFNLIKSYSSTDELVDEFYSNFYACAMVTLIVQFLILFISLVLINRVDMRLVFMAILLTKLVNLLFVVVELLLIKISLMGHTDLVTIMTVAISDITLLIVSFRMMKVD